MNKRYYTIEIILYTDNQEHMLLLKQLQSKYNYACIIHDKDKDDDGNIKKEHIHLLIFFNNARWGSSILKEINIDNPNLIQFRDNKVESIRYLIHADNKNKYQYNVCDIDSNINIEIYFSSKDDETKDISLIIEYISDYVGIINFYQIYYFVIENNCWSTYRRNYSIIKDLMIEHNYYFTNED